MSPMKNGRWLSAIRMCLMVSVFLLLAASGGLAESEQKTDASGQWRYVIENGSVMIKGCVVELHYANKRTHRLYHYTLKGGLL